MSTVEVQTKPAGAGIVSTSYSSAGTVYIFADGNQINTDNIGIIRPLSAAIGVNTDYVITTPSKDETAFVIIPKEYLKSTVNTAASILLTIKTDTPSKETVIIPLSGSGDTITSNSLMFTIYIGADGNIYSEDFSISGTNANGSWIQLVDGTMEVWGKYDWGSRAAGIEVFAGVTIAASFVDTNFYPTSGGLLCVAAGGAANTMVQYINSVNSITLCLKTHSAVVQSYVTTYSCVGRWK